MNKELKQICCAYSVLFKTSTLILVFITQYLHGHILRTECELTL